MKDETKNKLKHFGRAMAYVMGICIALCAGLVLGKCSSDSAHKNQMSVRADDDEVEQDLLAGAVYYHANWEEVTLSGQTQLHIFYLNYVKTTCLHLPAGLYRYTFDVNGSIFSCNSTFAGYVALCTTPSYSFYTSIGDEPEFLFYRLVSVSGEFESYYVYLSEGYYAFQSNNNSHLSLVDSIDIPAENVINFDTKYWFPYQVWGTDNAPVIRGPVHDTNNMSNRSVELTGLVFRSNGVVYNGIRFVLQPLAVAGSTSAQQHYAEAYGYYDDSGNRIWLESNHSDFLWYFSDVQYMRPDGTYDRVGGQRLKVYDDYSNAVTQYFDWVSREWATIELVYADDSTIVSAISTSQMTAKQWINAIANSTLKATEDIDLGMGSVFTMLTAGFETFASVFAINILPGVSLGLLLFTPLIVIVIFAILRVLNK